MALPLNRQAGPDESEGGGLAVALAVEGGGPEAAVKRGAQRP